MFEIYSEYGCLLGFAATQCEAAEKFANWTQASFVIYRDGRGSRIAMAK